MEISENGKTTEELGEQIKALEKELKKTKRELAAANETILRNRETHETRQVLLGIAETEKATLEHFMGLILSNCPDIILLFDADGKLLYYTDAFMNVSNVGGAAFLRGVDFETLLSGTVSPEMTDVLRSIFAGGELEQKNFELSEQIDFSGSGERSYGVQITAMTDSGGAASGAMVFFYDTTELLSAKQAAEKANEAKSSFLAIISHEIRTPMNAVLGQLTMIRDTELTDRQYTLIAGIEKSAKNLLNLINDILDFSKIDAGKLDIVYDWFDIIAVIEHIRSIFTVLIGEKGLNFKITINDPLPPCVWGDEKRVNQVLMNLLSNAMKYTNEGSVELVISRAEADEGQFSEKIIKTFWIFEVRDTGIGIRPQEKDRLFHPFEQLDQVKNKNVAGTGLGLVITKNLCELMGGSIEARSEYGKGSQFIITLPLREGELSDIRTGTEEAQSFTAPEASVLIVDDIEINIEIAQFLLETTFAIKSDKATSGAQALSMCEKKKYDIIFMDHMMPEMDGIETVRRLRTSDSENRSAMVVALTANAISGIAEMFYKNGFNGFVSKPMDINELSKSLLRLLPKEKIVMNESEEK
ncbi:MAG: response regulator [Ruminococcus sp.]|jgi:signal transduction histidine kinase/ActR/RegA family two-component response regulator|nr:response regulator [Ruminococcus sp.]